MSADESLTFPISRCGHYYSTMEGVSDAKLHQDPEDRYDCVYCVQERADDCIGYHHDAYDRYNDHTMADNCRYKFYPNQEDQAQYGYFEQLAERLLADQDPDAGYNCVDCIRERKDGRIGFLNDNYVAGTLAYGNHTYDYNCRYHIPSNQEARGYFDMVDEATELSAQ